MLSEAARDTLAWLEGEWQHAYSRGGKGKGWRSFTLIQMLQQKNICETELHAWQVLEELGRAEFIALPTGVLLSPRAKLPVKIELAAARREALMSVSPALDPRLALEPRQHSAWRRAQEGPAGAGAQPTPRSHPAGAETAQPCPAGAPAGRRPAR